MDTLYRQGSPFSKDIWEKIDEAAASAARDALTARRFLEVEGPFGIALKFVEKGRPACMEKSADNKASLVITSGCPVPFLHQNFQLAATRLASFIEMNQPINLTPVQQAAEAIAAREEEIIYFGNKESGLEGLLNAKGKNQHATAPWNEVQKVLDDVVAAVNLLDKKGFNGPYALALSFELYNSLFRIEADSLQLIRHLQRLFVKGVYKAPIQGGVIVDPKVGKIILGQDLQAGYNRQDGITYELFLSESLVFVLEEPEAICTIQMTH